MKKIIATFNKNTSISEIDKHIKKLLENFDPEQEVEILMNEDHKEIEIYIEKSAFHKKPDLKVIK